MRLKTAHRILIATAIVFFFGFSLWQFNRYMDEQDRWAVVQGVIYFGVAIGFVFYFRHLKTWLK